MEPEKGVKNLALNAPGRAWPWCLIKNEPNNCTKHHGSVSPLWSPLWILIMQIFGYLTSEIQLHYSDNLVQCWVQSCFKTILFNSCSCDQSNPRAYRQKGLSRSCQPLPCCQHTAPSLQLSRSDPWINLFAFDMLANQTWPGTAHGSVGTSAAVVLDSAS